MACPFGGLLSGRVSLDDGFYDGVEDGAADGAADAHLMAPDGVEDEVLGSEDDSSADGCR
jgi:hypothetical protein